MKVSGSHVLHAPPRQVWDALQDPTVLVRTIPGCHALEEDGPDRYRATVRAGVASISGTYDGRVALSQQDPPTSYVLTASGSGGPGTIDATATVRLVDDGDGATTVHYDADAVVGGAVGGVGQRVLAGVAKRNAAAFFAAVDQYLAGDIDAAGDAAPAGTGDTDRSAGPAATGAEPAGAGTADAAATGTGGAASTPAGAPRVFTRPSAPPSGPPPSVHLLLAALLGAAIALAGVLAGRRLAR